jgi:hypothetical protein
MHISFFFCTNFLITAQDAPVSLNIFCTFYFVNSYYGGLVAGGGASRSRGSGEASKECVGLSNATDMDDHDSQH